MSLQDSHQISDVKVMLVKGIDGNGIESIEKTSTQGLVDVYTITYTNGEKTTFTVTNGAGGGMPALIIISSEAGSDVSVTAPSGRALVVEQVSGSSTLWQCETTEYGTHLIDSVLGGDDAQVSLNVDACKIYTIDDNHFHADITVTYPDGASCSCGKSGETPVYATDNPFTFTVHSAGEYIITVDANGQTFTETVTLTTSGQEESVSLPVGSTVTPTDVVGTLIACANIGNSEITTMAELLADSTTLSAVIASENAVDYLVRSTTFRTEICANQSAMSLIGLNNNASDTLLADESWLHAIAHSAYMSSILNYKNAYMTSNNTPSGICFGSGGFGSATTWYLAFDGSETGDGMRLNVGGMVGYYFPKSTKVYYVNVNNKYSSSDNPTYRMKDVEVLGSNDGTNFTTLKSFTNSSTTQYFQIELNPMANYSRYALKVNTNYGGTYVSALEVTFYGRNNV